MKLTESQLRQVIREELESLFSEGLYDNTMDTLHDLTGGYVGIPDPERQRQRRNVELKRKYWAQETARKQKESENDGILRDPADVQTARKANERK
jgi:hypothetical protein